MTFASPPLPLIIRAIYVLEFTTSLELPIYPMSSVSVALGVSHNPKSLELLVLIKSSLVRCSASGFLLPIFHGVGSELNQIFFFQEEVYSYDMLQHYQQSFRLSCGVNWVSTDGTRSRAQREKLSQTLSAYCVGAVLKQSGES